jgi:hypothetical protein
VQSLTSKIQIHAGTAPAPSASSSDPSAKADGASAGDVSVSQVLLAQTVDAMLASPPWRGARYHSWNSSIPLN